MRVGRKKISTSCLIVSKYVMIVKKKKKKKTRYNRYLFPLFVSSNRYEPARIFYPLTGMKIQSTIFYISVFRI